jgi:hypothetical protein
MVNLARRDIAQFMQQHVIDTVSDEAIDDKDWEITHGGYVDIFTDCRIVAKGELSRLPVKFGLIDGDFSVYGLGLETLENCPDVVNGSFDCSHNKLKDLLDAPETVAGEFYCTHNPLRSLHGCVDYTEIDCRNCNLTKLDGLGHCHAVLAYNNPLKTLHNLPTATKILNITYNNDLALLGALTVDWLNILDDSFQAMTELENVIRPFLNATPSTLKRAQLQCAYALTKAGYASNARI